jgi:CRISPR type III-A-associated protein Csm2
MRDRRYTQPAIQQPLPKIIGFYTEDGKTMRPELLDSDARALGGAFAEIRQRKKGPHYVSSTQLRRYYNDVKQLQFKIERDLKEKKDSDDPEALKEYLPLIKMLKAKVAYGTRPGTVERVSPKFQETIDDCVGLIKRPKDFQAFVLFFESIVGYYYGAGGGK